MAFRDKCKSVGLFSDIRENERHFGLPSSKWNFCSFPANALLPFWDNVNVTDTNNFDQSASRSNCSAATM